jgi:Raf kinase inhibitor-like YbhB/YbcL family protein
MRTTLIGLGALGITALLMGCPPKTTETKGDPAVPKPKPEPKTEPAALTVTSPAFEAGKAMPKKHAYKGEGENVSPALSWSGAPKGTKSFAVICDDPDAPSAKNPRPNPWVHWVVYNIPADKTALAEGETGGGATGTTDFKETAWGGPMPPPGSGTHRYFFKVFALDSLLELAPGATKAELLKAMEGHVLARGEVFGTYIREKAATAE